jgi:hypothetical protein
MNDYCLDNYYTSAALGVELHAFLARTRVDADQEAVLLAGIGACAMEQLLPGQVLRALGDYRGRPPRPVGEQPAATRAPGGRLLQCRRRGWSCRERGNPPGPDPASRIDAGLPWPAGAAATPDLLPARPVRGVRQPPDGAARGRRVAAAVLCGVSAAVGQKDSSGRSMSARSTVAAIWRRAVNSGRTVWVKKCAAPSLPS